MMSFYINLSIIVFLKKTEDRVKSFLIDFKNSEKYYQDSQVKYRSEDGKHGWI